MLVVDGEQILRDLRIRQVIIYPIAKSQDTYIFVHSYYFKGCISRKFLGNTDDPRYNDNDYSIYYSGFVVVSSPFINPLGFYLASAPSDPRDQGDACIHSHAWHGQPLVQVVQTAGSFTKSFEIH